MQLKKHSVPSAAAIFDDGLSEATRSISTQYRQRLDEKYTVPAEDIRQQVEAFAKERRGGK